MPQQWWLGAYGADMEGGAEGVSLLTSRDDGSLELVRVSAQVLSPTFVAARGDHLYAAAEGTGRIHSYRIDGEHLVEDGVVHSGGDYPCQLEFLEGAIVAANYGAGELGVITLAESGAVDALAQVLTNTGSGPHKEQDSAHAHASLRYDESTLFSADLGADRILIHSIEGSVLTRTGELALPPGTGPRDLARHSSGLLLVLGEHGRDLHVLEWTGQSLEIVTRLDLPGAGASDQAAAIGFGPNGFVYAGLRGTNQISVVRISDDGRRLTAVGAVPTEGDWPRNLVVDGDLLHVCNQRSSTVASFRLGTDGMPELIAPPTPLPSPTFLLRA
ncbi:lactonase family protein [Salinibacterium soli]|uniref:Beta-propeller fold lactonase family protein n=1 Tax=Antiquaquibacter soli TaxID=3064523 RepID=A0ABT9BMD7_9MICO|nr:beta-propeller fold lactonase family protein [Protaetiibacter sp. WY-16]MDO7882155.1 beta-propeller fold lactonase family protein [Protaetiibacter sp. WY-16]